MSDLKDKVYSFVIDSVVDNFHHPLSLIFLYFIILLVFVSPCDSLFNNNFGQNKIIVYGIAALVIFAYWLYYRYSLPRNHIKKTGLVISIYATGMEGVRIKNNLIRQLEKNINNAGLGHIFKIIVLKNHQAKKIKSKDDLNRINKKVKAHLYLMGEVIKSPDGENIERYFISLDGYVAHQPVPASTSQNLSIDFRAVLPKDINFATYFEFRGCKITANIAYLTTRYITGVAALLSQNPFLAMKLHEGLIQEFDKFSSVKKDIANIKGSIGIDLKNINKIRKKIPLILAEECMVISRFYYYNNNLKLSKHFLDKSFIYNGQNYGYWLSKSIFDFMLNGNTADALKSLKNAERYSPGGNVWRYNKAFILFWKEDYVNAMKECHKLSTTAYNNELLTCLEVEEFNQDILTKHPDKIQLYFWLGYIKYKKEGNLTMALKYFEEFNNKANKSMDYLKQKSDSYLIEIRRGLQI